MASELLLSTRGDEWECLQKRCFDFGKAEKHTGERLMGEEYLEQQDDSEQEEWENGLVVEESSWHCKTLLVQWGRRLVVDPLLFIVRREVEPKLLSLSAALGLTLGVFPVCGITLFLCALAAALLRSACSVPTLMLANFIATPLELGLIVPFLRVGELVTGGRHFLLSSILSYEGIWKAITGHASHAVIFGFMHAVIGWMIVAPFLLAILYIIFLPAFRFLIIKFGADPLQGPQLPVHFVK
eukprot:c26685_g1_i2 orf=735-1457(+)